MLLLGSIRMYSDPTLLVHWKMIPVPTIDLTFAAAWKGANGV